MGKDSGKHAGHPQGGEGKHKGCKASVLELIGAGKLGANSGINENWINAIQIYNVYCCFCLAALNLESFFPGWDALICGEQISVVCKIQGTKEVRQLCQ